MKVNTQKTEVIVSNRKGYEKSEDDTKLKQTREFKYLGPIIAVEGGTEKAVRQRIKDGWQKWREVE